MPGIKQLIKYISDDVSIQLALSVLGGSYGLGKVASVGTVAGLSALGVSPMVVTTSAPHGLTSGQWVTIFGAVGHHSATFPNPADPPAFQHSIDGAWQVTVNDATHFSVADGLTPGVSNGYYASGGTIVTGPLTDGHVLLGRQHLAEGSSAPRIVFCLARSEWPGKGMYDPSTAQPQDSLGTQKLARSIWTELYVFEVHVWGQLVAPYAPQGDPDGGDKDVTQLLYQQIIRSLDQMARGSWDILPGRFTNEQPGAATLNRAGEEFVFFLKMGSPIPENYLQFAPPLTPNLTIRFAGGAT